MSISIFGERTHGTRSIAKAGSIKYVIAFEVISKLHSYSVVLHNFLAYNNIIIIAYSKYAIF